MPLPNVSLPYKIAVLGSLPPLRALSGYCLEFSRSISRLVETEFISFKHIYPSFLYPGGKVKKDYTFPEFENTPNLKVRRNITWYNPLTWFSEGFFTEGKILHVQWWSPPLIFIYLTICLLYKLRGRPVAITVHNVLQHEKIKYYKIFSSILFKLCDHFIVHSEINSEILSNSFNIDVERITVIPHGPLDFFNQEEIDLTEARNDLGLSRQDKVILFFGAIRNYKGLDVALNAFAETVKEIPEARLVVAGRLWEPWDRYEKIIKEKNISNYIIKYLHYIESDQVAKFFIASDLIVLPYHHFDSQSGVGTTAVAFKKPMIVTRVGGLPDLVLDHENILPPGDINALAGRIITCLKDNSIIRKMSEETDIIAEQMSWQNVAVKTLSIYKKLINLKN